MIEDDSESGPAGALLEPYAGTALFADIVDSVRLMEQDERAAVVRWVALLNRARAEILPRHRGELIKGTGDGFLAVFERAGDAAAAALAISALLQATEAEAAPDPAQRIRLRMGLASGRFSRSRDDVYGQDVNLAARLMTLAGPDEIVIGASTRDLLTEGLDAALIDLGQCWVRNVAEPVRAFRLGPPSLRRTAGGPAPSGDARPSLAMLPLTPRLAPPEAHVLGEAVAEESLRALARSPFLSVISRLSAAAVAGRGMTITELAQVVGADYVVSGTFDADGGQLRLNLDLTEARGGRLIWTEAITRRVADLFAADQPLIGELTGAISRSIVSHELALARRAPLPTLRAYTLLLGAVTSLHRLSRRDFEFAQGLLDALIQRSPRHAPAHAWLAYWHAMRVHQGWSENRERDAWLASTASARALDLDPDCPLATTVDGAVHANLLRRLDVARDRYDAALDRSPSEAMAWAMRAALNAFEDRGAAGVEDAAHAIRLAPLDPHRYLFDAILASAHLTAGDDAAALEAVNASLRANRVHASALRVKTVACWRLGRGDEARAALTELLTLEPGFTTGAYLARAANPDGAIARDIARALREAGAPE